jgi:hypothetical protein
MTRLKRIGMRMTLISAILAMIGVGPAVNRAGDPAAATPAVPPQKTGKQKAAAARAARQAKRLLAQRRAQAQEKAYIAGYGNGTGYGGYSTAGWNPNSSSLSGLGSANLSGMGSTGSSGSTSGMGTNSTSGTASNANTVSPTYNAKILEFAVNHLGMQVGNGECSTLAADALIYAGAKPADGYVFGAKIPMSSIQGGDILQFENALFAGQLYWLRLGFPHHTAIVDSVQGTTVVVLQQNYNNSRVVRMTALDFADFQSGTVTAYRAVAPTTTDSAPTTSASASTTTTSAP